MGAFCFLAGSVQSVSSSSVESLSIGLLSQDTGWEERLRAKSARPILCQVERKTLTQSTPWKVCLKV